MGCGYGSKGSLAFSCPSFGKISCKESIFSTLSLKFGSFAANSAWIPSMRGRNVTSVIRRRWDEDFCKRFMTAAGVLRGEIGNG